MVEDLDNEACKSCAIKHLSTALVTLTDPDALDRLRGIYFCGNLAHAANHLIHLETSLAERARQIRLTAQDSSLAFILPYEQIVDALSSLIKDVADYQPPQVVQDKPPEVPQRSHSSKQGCRCHGHA